MRSPEFHQIAIMNGDREWQKNEGDYFPEWLREIAVALIEPVPHLDQVLQQVEEADVKRLMGNTYFSWMMMSTDGNVQKGMGGSVAVTDSTGLLFYGNGPGWSGLYRDYKSFNGRKVARTISSGSPEVTAQITALEDLPDISPNPFDAQASGGDTPLLRTVVVDEPKLRENLLPADPVAWPPLKDGPLQGAVTAKIVVDRTGKVREIGSIASDNPGLSEAFGKSIGAMQFKPFLENGVAVQVVSRATMPFKTVRPAGVETFESARTYFESGRRVCFPAAGNGPPYVLHAVFQAEVKAGNVRHGEYVDTWKSDDEWRRQASVGESWYVRAKHGEKRYEFAEGPDAPLLRLLMKAMEPIPAIDTFVESDWSIRPDTVGGMKTVRVLAGYESPDGTLDPQHARAYWFDETGKLVKSYYLGIEIRRSEFEGFGGVEIARHIELLKNGNLGMLIRVIQVSPVGTVPKNNFDLSGHEWTRAFTDEVR